MPKKVVGMYILLADDTEPGYDQHVVDNEPDVDIFQLPLRQLRLGAAAAPVPAARRQRAVLHLHQPRHHGRARGIQEARSVARRRGDVRCYLNMIPRSGHAVQGHGGRHPL